MRQYKTSKGRVILSPDDLLYAINSRNEVQVDRLTSEHMDRILIVPNYYLADMVTELTNGVPYMHASLTLSNPFGREQRSSKNFIVEHQGTTYVRYGMKYLTMDNFLQAATPDGLEEAFRNAAFQCVLTRADIAIHMRGNAEEAG